MTSVDWQSQESVLLLNDRTPMELQDRFRSFHGKEKFPAHVFIATSGSTSLAPGELKLAALSKEAVLVAARAVNKWVEADSLDVWLNPLPEFHIGGLAIHARAHLAGSQVVGFSGKWNAQSFYKALQDSRATLTSLVPTQLYDLVKAGISAPAHLRAVFLGGAALTEELYRRARELTWPVLPTFGCSEAASQIATASLKSLRQNDYPPIQILPHVQYQLGKDQRLCLAGPSLFSGYFLFKNNQWTFYDPKEDGWFETEDRVEISDGCLRFLGRVADFVKVNGEGVDLQRLRKILSEPKVEILAIGDPRSGAKLVLVGEEETDLLEGLVKIFNAKVFPFERIQTVYSVERIPRSSLGKVLKRELLAQLDLPDRFG